MDQSKKAHLTQLAMRRLMKSATDDEPWSFAFRTPGAISLSYCPWETVGDWEFDGDVSGVQSQWKPDRIAAIENGTAEPDQEELAIWKKAKCVALADGSDWSIPAWIVPILERRKIAAWALIVCQSQEDASPIIEGVFADVASARLALVELGAVALDSR